MKMKNVSFMEKNVTDFLANSISYLLSPIAHSLFRSSTFFVIFSTLVFTFLVSHILNYETSYLVFLFLSILLLFYEGINDTFKDNFNSLYHDLLKALFFSLLGLTCLLCNFRSLKGGLRKITEQFL